MGPILGPSPEAESFRKKFFNVCLLGAVRALKEHGRVRAKLINHLPARATGRTGDTVIVRNGDSLNLNLRTKFSNGGEDRCTLCAVAHSVRGILDVATRKDLSIGQQDRRADPKL